MNLNNENENLKVSKEDKTFMEFLDYIFDTNAFTTKNKMNENVDIPKENKEKREKEKYIPQIGDEVYILDYIVNGESKKLTGEIVADVELYDCYQVKISEINAIYVPKGLVRVIKKKSDKEKKEKIAKLKEEISEGIESRNELLKSRQELRIETKRLEQELNELLKKRRESRSKIIGLDKILQDKHKELKLLQEAENIDRELD